jgi:uncharacterized protein
VIDPGISFPIAPIVLLALSNVFMTLAWYGHLKFKAAPLYAVILISWGIAFFEYCLAVPANRIGHQVYSAAQLKTIQEVITLTVFAGFLGRVPQGEPELEHGDRLRVHRAGRGLRVPGLSGRDG